MISSSEDTITDGSGTGESSLPNPTIDDSGCASDDDDDNTSIPLSHSTLLDQQDSPALPETTPDHERTLSTTERLQQLLFHHPQNILLHNSNNNNNDTSRWKFWSERLGSVFYAVWLLWQEDPWAWIQLSAWTTIPSTLVLLLVVHLNSIVIMNGRVIMNTTSVATIADAVFSDSTTIMGSRSDMLGLLEEYDHDDTDDESCPWLYPVLEQRLRNDPDGDPRFWIHNFVSMCKAVTASKTFLAFL